MSIIVGCIEEQRGEIPWVVVLGQTRRNQFIGTALFSYSTSCHGVALASCLAAFLNHDYPPSSSFFSMVMQSVRFVLSESL